MYQFLSDEAKGSRETLIYVYLFPIFVYLLRKSLRVGGLVHLSQVTHVACTAMPPVLLQAL